MVYELVWKPRKRINKWMIKKIIIYRYINKYEYKKYYT